MKMAAGDSAGVVADNVDNTYVSVSGVCACVCVCVHYPQCLLSPLDYSGEDWHMYIASH